MDVSVVTSVFPGATQRAFAAVERREKMKHSRYPGTGLYAFCLDVRGRWGREAHAFVQSMAGSLSKEERAAAMKCCRKRVSEALQTALAE